MGLKESLQITKVAANDWQLTLMKLPFSPRNLVQIYLVDCLFLSKLVFEDTLRCPVFISV